MTLAQGKEEKRGKAREGDEWMKKRSEEGVKAREKTKDQDGKKSSRIKVRKRDVAGSKREGEGGERVRKLKKHRSEREPQ